MRKKLILTVDAEVYEGLCKIVGPRKISRFIEGLVRPYVIRPNLDATYAKMAQDKDGENDALEWAEVTIKDVNNAAGCSGSTLIPPSVKKLERHGRL